MAKQKINCPVCGRAVEYNSVSDVPTLPFCSGRCKWADMDHWLEGDYRISQDVTETLTGEDAGPTPPDRCRLPEKP